jgi:hypothetical protein
MAGPNPLDQRAGSRESHLSGSRVSISHLGLGSAANNCQSATGSGVGLPLPGHSTSFVSWSHPTRAPRFRQYQSSHHSRGMSRPMVRALCSSSSGRRVTLQAAASPSSRSSSAGWADLEDPCTRQCASTVRRPANGPCGGRTRYRIRCAHDPGTVHDVCGAGQTSCGWSRGGDGAARQQWYGRTLTSQNGD